jgi:hypothetical protein
MANYSMTCTCGDTMTLAAPTREAAVSMFKAGMTEQAIDQHMREKHQPGEPKPTVEQAHAMIEQTVRAV